jgi:hypothetical protein
MSFYCVTAVWPEHRLAALSDRLGKRHVVQLNAEIPAVDAELEGKQSLRVGFAALLADRTGQVFDITPDAVACSEQYVYERLHIARAVVRSRALAR